MSQYESGEAAVAPVATAMVTNPSQDPALAQQYANAKAAAARRNAGYGAALPSGFAAQEQNDLATNYVQDQDQAMTQRQLQGAQLLNPYQAASTASSGNTSVMNAPLQNQFWSNLLGGILGGFKFGGNSQGQYNYQFKHGGRVPRTGLALVHKDEVVLTPQQRRKMLSAKDRKTIPYRRETVKQAEWDKYATSPSHNEFWSSLAEHSVAGHGRDRRASSAR